MNWYLKNALNYAHYVLRSTVKDGDVVVDATSGNGNDTLLLCNLVGPQGRVYAFDIQEKAVTATREKMTAYGLTDRSECILDSHENIGNYVSVPISAAVFNLGFLPGANRQITTRPVTTIKALEKLLPLIKPGGLVVVVVYPGHEEGAAEKIALEDYTSGLDQTEHTVIKVDFINQINNPPLVLLIEKGDNS